MTTYSIKDKLAFGPQSWQMLRFLAKLDKQDKAIEYNRQKDDNGALWVEHPSNGLRFVGSAHDISRREEFSLDHKGWFLDDFQDETVFGVVYQLPTRNGVLQFVPGNCDPFGNDGASLDFWDIRDNLRDAVYAADRLAETYAEAEREFRAKDQAEQRVEAISEEIKQAYASCRALCAEVRENCAKLDGLSVLRGLIKAEVRRTRCTLRKLYKERAELRGEWGMA